jgi:hypothetical protein
MEESSFAKYFSKKLLIRKKKIYFEKAKYKKNSASSDFCKIYSKRGDNLTEILEKERIKSDTQSMNQPIDQATNRRSERVINQSSE